jgi:hypothetical protein
MLNEIFGRTSLKEALRKFTIYSILYTLYTLLYTEKFTIYSIQLNKSNKKIRIQKFEFLKK